jgi:tetratricopeptide (TPR) repeat protein
MLNSCVGFSQTNQKWVQRTMNFKATGVGLLLLFSALSPSSHAAITVIGTGLAQECYQAAEREVAPRRGLEICNNALTSEVLTPRDLSATYVNRAIFKMRLKDTQGALDDFAAAERANARLADIYVNRGMLYLTLNRNDEAFKDLNMGLSLGSARPQLAYYGRAIAHENAGRIKEAFLDFRKANELEPEWDLPKQELTRFKVVETPSPAS